MALSHLKVEFKIVCNFPSLLKVLNWNALLYNAVHDIKEAMMDSAVYWWREYDWMSFKQTVIGVETMSL